MLCPGESACLSGHSVFVLVFVIFVQFCGMVTLSLQCQGQIPAKIKVIFTGNRSVLQI